MTRILLISGSARRGSTNAAVLATAAGLTDAETELYDTLTDLPIFNPDDDEEGKPIPPAVAGMRAAVARADGILICTPEYAGALPAGLKNLLEWTVGDAGTYRKPVAWVNAAGAASPTGAADAHDSLRKVLGYVHADIVEDACARVPVSRGMVGATGTIADGAVRGAIEAAITRLSRASARP